MRRNHENQNDHDRILPPQESALITPTSEQIEIVQSTAPPIETEITARGTPRRQASKQAKAQIHSTIECSTLSGSASKSPTLRQSTTSKKHNQEDTETISSSSELSELSVTDLAEASEGMKKWKPMHKIKSRKIKSSKQTRLSHTHKVQSAPSVSEEGEVENTTASKPMDKNKAQSPAYDPANDPRLGDIHFFCGNSWSTHRNQTPYMYQTTSHRDSCQRPCRARRCPLDFLITVPYGVLFSGRRGGYTTRS